jgi:hypothetical protein
MTTITQNDIAKVFAGLLDGIAHDNAQAYIQFAQYPAVVAVVASAKKGNPEALRALQQPFEKILDGLIAREVSENFKARFLLLHSQYVLWQFRRVIEQLEGSACCADKAKTILRSLLRFFLTGEKIVFDRNQQYTFHLPESVFAEHAEIVRFFDALCTLYHGDPAPYVDMLSTLSAGENAH